MPDEQKQNNLSINQDDDRPSRFMVDLNKIAQEQAGERKQQVKFFKPFLNYFSQDENKKGVSAGKARDIIDSYRPRLKKLAFFPIIKIFYFLCHRVGWLAVFFARFVYFLLKRTVQVFKKKKTEHKIKLVSTGFKRGTQRKGSLQRAKKRGKGRGFGQGDSRENKASGLLLKAQKAKKRAMGRVQDILNIKPLKEKWLAFGWETDEINGHDFEEIENSLEKREKEKPKVVIAKTIKGKGVSFMEGNNLYHYKAPSPEEYQKALKELQSNG